MLTGSEVCSRRDFSRERPTKPDLELWCHALRSITSMQLTLESPLGPYLVPPHNTEEWFATNDESELFLKREDGAVDVYTRPTDCRVTKCLRYTQVESRHSLPDESLLRVATVLRTAQEGSVSLHSTSTILQSPQTSHRTVPDLLRSTKNPDLWRNFKCDGDGWWIRDALFSGTLRSVSDGSYMRDEHIGACSAGFTLNNGDGWENRQRAAGRNYSLCLTIIVVRFLELLAFFLFCMPFCLLPPPSRYSEI